MRLIPAIVAALTLGGATASYAPGAEARHIFVGVGIAMPAFAVAASAPFFVAPVPYYYYGPAYAPAFYAAPPVVIYRSHVRDHYGRPSVLRRAWH
jgi:hypothetical protein